MCYLETAPKTKGVKGDHKPRVAPSRGEEVITGCSCLSSLSLPLNSWPLTGAADVRAGLGHPTVSVVFSCQFSAPQTPTPPHPSTTPPSDCSWLMSKLLQLFVGVTFAEADWQTGSGAHSLGGVSGVSVWCWQQRGLKGWFEHDCYCGYPLLTAFISGRDHTSKCTCDERNNLLSVTCGI